VIGGGENNRIKSTADHGVIDGGNANTASGQYASVAGGSQNTASGGSSAVGGGNLNTAGGSTATVGGGAANSAGGTSATVGGGVFNNASGIYSTVGGGGFDSSIFDYATVSGGENNMADGTNAAVGGGYDNIATNFSVIAGGYENQALGQYSTIAGGALNYAYDFSSVGGGSDNSAEGTESTVSGGEGNFASGQGATVPGGYGNGAIGVNSFAAGQAAVANNNNSFVWSDGTGLGGNPFQDTGPAQFLIQATGGVGINLNNPTGDALSVGGTLRMNNENIYLRAYPDANHGLGYYGTSDGTTFGGISPDGPVLFGYSGGALGTDQNGTTHVALQWTTTSVTVSGTFNNNSDRNAKENFSHVSAAHILEKVAQLPLSEWSYKTDSATRHIGPMAQDFYAAFNVGTDEKHIAPIDEGGVALAAIQGLNQKLTEKDAEIQQLKQSVNELKQLVQTLAEKK
jgi:hypothetical protein